MDEANTTEFLNCSARYTLNQTNISPLSVTERHPDIEFLKVFLPSTLLLIRCFMPVWLVVGLFGNSLSFAIWITRHQRRKSTSAIYLTALSLADFILILILLNYHLERYWSIAGVTTVSGLCQVYQCLSIFAQYYSTTLVFGFTVERYIAVCFPFKRHKLCTHRRALIAVIVLLIICLIPMTFQAPLWTFVDGVCAMRNEWVHDPTVQSVLYGQEIIFSLIVPLSALVFNILVLKEIRRITQATAIPSSQRSGSSGDILSKIRRKSRKSSSLSGNTIYSSDGQLGESKGKESSTFVATTIMLVILSFYLIACALPPGITYLAQFHTSQPDECMTDEAIQNDPGWSALFNGMRTKEIIDVLCASHYAVNFFIYLFTYKGFREHVVWILRCRVTKLRNLSKSAADKIVFPRRTGPKLVKMGPLSRRSEEYNSLVNESMNGTHLNHSTVNMGDRI
ncbi:unnamed protein product [Calicophoron daubneyi]|uniref:G-protein coupled receptors family 1 profile domain-containing protein n=1 Tax=Calicophoron daubneyi TaxID=300641 RepID=A0AAV2TQG8_CALDB